MAENTNLKKFIPQDYISGNCLIADYHGNISICGNDITFSFLEFDEAVKINLTGLVLSKDKDNILDQEINRFKGKNANSSTDPVNFETLNYTFSGCVFNANVYFNPLENSVLTINYCTFKEHFYINNGYLADDKVIKVNTIIIENSTFEKDFGVYKAEIKTINIKNVDFELLSEFNEVTFQKEFDLQEITYKGFTLFDNCVFNAKAEFKYIIFEKFASFRESTFNRGLNLDYTSGDKEINFFGINGLESNESKNETTRETYRIIKYNFEEIGNKIEANKYHALELDQKRRELERTKWQNLKEYIVFKLHDLSSEHSTNWILSLFWIFAVGFLTVFLLHFDIAKDLFFHPNHFKIEYIGKIVNQLFEFIYIGNTNKELNNNPFIFLLNKVSLGYLYYQFVTATRKDTRK